METIKIQGGIPLKGTVTIGGAKNSALPILAAAMLTEEPVVIENVPNVADCKTLITIMRDLNVAIDYIDEHTVRIDSGHMQNVCVDSEGVSKMRASYYLLGVLLGRFHEACVAFPGGCNFGVRPIDIHLKGFRALGAQMDVGAMIELHADHLKGRNIFLDFPSVGATINIMLAAVYAEGTTIIENAAKEPHIVDTANFLSSMGADVKGAGTATIRIRGVKKLHGTTYAIIPDQIEAGTYMVAAAATRGDVTVTNVISRHMDSVCAKLAEAGVGVEELDEDAIRIIGTKDMRPTRIKTMPYPGFPTDMQPQTMVLLSMVRGTSMINDTIFDRFRHVEQLTKMGANINVEGQIAIIEGVDHLEGCTVEATDLRAGAAMVIAGLAAQGETTVTNIKYIERGYESMVAKLQALGADIWKDTGTGSLKVIKGMAN